MIEARLRFDRLDFRLDVDLELPGEGVTAIFGSSGSGKTTLLRLMAGLERAPGGRVALNEETWQDSDSARFVPTNQRPVGYVFQEPSLFRHLSVRGNLEYGWRRVIAGERTVDFDETVSLLGVGRLLDRSPGELSGGERQRVATARALLTSPRLLLMDEPLAALDQRARAAILPYLERLHRELSIPVLYVSHSVDEVFRLADHVVLLEEGRVRASGSLLDLAASLEDPIAEGGAAQAILESEIVAHDEENGLTVLAFAGGQLEVPRLELALGTAVRVGVRARDVSLALEAPERTSILNILQARITALRPDGESLLMVRLTVGGTTLLARVTQKSGRLLRLEPGLELYAQVKAVALLR